MVFVLQNWGQIAKTANTSVNYNEDGTPAAIKSSPDWFSYYSATDTLAQITASNYFTMVCNGLKPSDVIYISASDGQMITVVVSVNIVTRTIMIAEIANSAEPPIFSNTRNMNPSDIVQTKNVPVMIVPGVPGKTIVPLSMYFALTFVTTAYNANTDQPFGIYYSNGSNPILGNAISNVINRAFWENTSSGNMIVTVDNPSTGVNAVSLTTGAGLRFSQNGVGEYTGGNGSVAVTTNYILV